MFKRAGRIGHIVRKLLPFAFFPVPGIPVIVGAVSVVSSVIKGAGAKKAQKVAEQEAEIQRMQLFAAEQQIQGMMSELQQSDAARFDEMNQQLQNLDAQGQQRLQQFAASMQANFDNYDIDTNTAIEIFSMAARNTIEQARGNQMQGLQDFSNSMGEAVLNYAVEQGKLQNITADQLEAIREQMSADLSANISAYTAESGLATEEESQQFRQALAEYDQAQAARNQNMQLLLQNASDEFRKTVGDQAAIREKVVGDCINNLGMSMNNTNVGIAEVLGLTPEQNLEKARLASTDFATEYLQTTGNRAGQLAQMQARGAGMTAGQAALMGATAITEAMNGNWNDAVKLATDQYRQAEELQRQRLEEEYNKQKELTNTQLEQQQITDEQNRAAAETQSSIERENAEKAAQMAQADQARRLEAAQAAAKQEADRKQQTAQNAAQMESDRAKQEADLANMDAKTIAEMANNTNNTILEAEKEQANKELDTSIDIEAQAREAALATQQKELDAAMQKEATQLSESNKAAQALNEAGRQNEQDSWQRGQEAREAEQDADRYAVDQAQRTADRAAQINTSAQSNLQTANENAGKAAGEVGDAIVGGIGAVGDAMAGTGSSDDKGGN